MRKSAEPARRRADPQFGIFLPPARGAKAVTRYLSRHQGLLSGREVRNKLDALHELVHRADEETQGYQTAELVLAVAEGLDPLAKQELLPETRLLPAVAREVRAAESFRAMARMRELLAPTTKGRARPARDAWRPNRGMDLSDSPATSGQLKRRLLGAYLLDSLRNGQPSRRDSSVQPRQFFDRVATSVRPRSPTLGEGIELEIEGAGLVGSALLYEDQIWRLVASSEAS